MKGNEICTNLFGRKPPNIWTELIKICHNVDNFAFFE